MSLTINNAQSLMEKIASNQGWYKDNIQHCKKSEEVKEEVCALSTKMDVLLINWLEQRANYKKDRQAIHDTYNSQNICDICGNTGHSGNNWPKAQEDVNFIISNSGSQQQRQGWGQQERSNYQGYLGNQYNSFNPNQPSQRDLILEQAKINENHYYSAEIQYWCLLTQIEKSTNAWIPLQLSPKSIPGYRIYPQGSNG